MPLATPNLAVFDTGSATADYNVIGVRPSSGAASTGGSDASDSIRDRSRSDIAAPKDGRTPPRRSTAVADPVPVFSPGSGRCPTRRNGRIRGAGIALVGIALAFFFILPLDAAAQTNRSANPHLATETNLVALAKKSFRRAHARYQNEPRDTEAAWQFARACFDLADVATESAERAEVAEQGIAACRQALARDPNSAPLHYYLGMNLGQLAQTKGLGSASSAWRASWTSILITGDPIEISDCFIAMRPPWAASAAASKPGNTCSARPSWPRSIQRTD